ncbi:hypothetical protein HPP92_005144 [Vanilla planifolia]|uniref:Large ribosomal RNA subunit accumulation protein YCED homolog 1, chloroplastic n=1 Tax=Vanilla planifolia TaxID=51239 RepID=A0A835RKU2_VANPL|nr:hypothetical protein HPP92_005144 [Vanilla planifolia]
MALLFLPWICFTSQIFSRALPRFSNSKHDVFFQKSLTSSTPPLVSRTSFLSQWSFFDRNLIISTSASSSSSFFETKITDFDSFFDELDPEDEELNSSPWEGAVLYRRDASVNHVEYSTTLERLGLSKLSSDLSRSTASAMGIRLPRVGKESSPGNETPVLISIDVTRRRRRLKLDGILRTVITLGCNRCAEPAAEIVFSNFTLLLTEDPIEEESGEINMVLHGPIKQTSSCSTTNDVDEDDESQIDEDDKLYFPAEVKQVDISKHIRDLVHVEITINAICNANCRGLCLQCGTNLNEKTCNCGRADKQRVQHGPLRGLGDQLKR